MKNVLKKIVFAVLLIPILIILISLFLPARYHVERSVVMKSDAATIFPYLNELRRWPEWTAWTTNREPSLVYAHAGPAQGVGAVQSWTAQSGNGSIKLTAAEPKLGVSYELTFDKGRFVSTGHIHLSAVDGGTRVTWTNEGELGKNPVARYLGLLMDKWMGADFETGLQNLKARVEAVR